MNAEGFKKRTKVYANRVIRLVESLPHSVAVDHFGKQLLRSATSVAANYRSCCRAKSRADFVNKMNTVAEECDESLFWMEMLVENKYVDAGRISGLLNEGNQILALVVASAKTARSNRRLQDRKWLPAGTTLNPKAVAATPKEIRNPQLPIRNTYV
jgi:four helix bundle protein